MREPDPALSPPRRPRRPPFRKLAVGLVLSLVTTYVALEVALHLFPQFLPYAYRESFAFHGIELFRPGVLDETPLEALPLPLMAVPWEGPPPTDMIDMGIAPRDVDVDARRYPNLILQTDDLGFPNATRPVRVDVLMVGDSFLVAAGVTRPPGLAARFVETTGRSVYNLGVAGCGPTHELYFMREVGLPMKPSLVLWFFFGGNDVYDVYAFRTRQREGHKTWGDVFADEQPPFLLVPDVLSFLRGRSGAARDETGPLPPLTLTSAAGEKQPMWFLGAYLSQLAFRQEDVEKRMVWQATTDTLRRARTEAEDAGARFVMVFLPSKPQVYLPYVEHDVELIHRMACFGPLEDPTLPPAEFLAAALENRAGTENALAAFCAAEGIPFFSATPALEELARRGEPGYLTTDTHWEVRGQDAILGPLVEYLTRQGLLTP